MDIPVLKKLLRMIIFKLMRNTKFESPDKVCSEIKETTF